MGRMSLRTTSSLLVAGAVLCGPLTADDKVALRTTSGRFLQALPDGTIRAERFFPAEQETFELIPRGKDQIALRAPNGRLLVPAGWEGRMLRADGLRADPRDQETFLVAAVEANRVALKAKGYRDFISFTAPAAPAPAPPAPDQPRPEQTVEIYRVSAVPDGMRLALAAAVQSLVMEKLAGQEYDKTTTREHEKYIELPDPTLGDLRRTRRHRILSTEEQYRVKAKLDGPLDIRITHMPYLKGYQQPGAGVLMFTVEARVPVQGWVQYKVPNVVDASTGFTTVVGMSLVGEFRAEKTDDQLALCPSKLLDVHVELQSLSISNDVLHAFRQQIKDLVNREIGKNQDRIQEQANEALRKAVEPQQLRSPLLGYLSLP